MIKTFTKFNEDEELKDFEEPKKITSIKLSHDNIIEYYKNRQKPSCQKCPDS